MFWNGNLIKAYEFIVNFSAKDQEVPFKEKKEWNLSAKYNIGKKIDENKEEVNTENE